ncbi:DUF4190 domain-containing protein [Streptomyces sp. CA-252508]|uniref:DUF4190 domain-containing protein n=1 Tax=Streptomyces sp. CA-252508 TaxID=3418946 RepID=UPI003D8F85A9
MPETSDSNDPWAPPGSRPPRDRVDPPPYQPPARPPGVHDQPTVTSVPGAGTGELPPPPTAPGGPGPSAPGPYGYPAATPPGGTYGYPAATPPAGTYGYPGYPGYGAYGQPGWQPAPSNGMGIAALVLGIVSVVLFCMWGFGIVPGILALVFGVLGRKKVQRGEADNHGVALAGIILGAVGIVVSGAFLAFLIWAVATSEGGSGHQDGPGGDPFDTSLVVPARS